MRSEKGSGPVPAFEELGITTLAVDEAHRYKNISFDIRLEGVVGMHTAGSRKCDEMMEKVQYVRRVREDTKEKGMVIFATATPLTNSICDVYTIQKYLQPEELELLHLGGFDQWINNFGQRHTGFEIDVDSQNYRIMTRFSSFHNLPELMNLLSEVVDFYDGNDYRTDLPNCSGYTDIVVPKSPEQAAYMQSLVDRTEAVRTGKVAKDKDNLLKITHDGQVASLDIRLVDSSVCPRPEYTKAAACAATIMQFLRKYPGTAQLVFCDLGTPKKEFNLYDELKSNLVRLGMKDQEIAYIHEADTEAQRRKLFAAVNRAEIKVLIGSTAKLGLGVNIQESLIAGHRLDIPCRPCDVIQSEGRLIRPGNQNPEVYLCRYVTEGLFDAYSWQKLENKQRFYSEFMSNAYKGRSAEDLTYMVLSDAEIKAIACGNPLIKLRVETGNMLEHARIQQRSREKELSEAWNVMCRTPGILTDLKKRKAGVERDYRLYEEKKQSMSREERTVFGERLLKELAGNASNTENRIFAKVFGFHVIFPAGIDLNKPKILLKGCSENVYVVSMKEAKAAGCLQRITAVLSSLPEKSKELEKNRQDMIKRCREAEKLYNEGNPYEKQIKELSVKLIQIDEELNREANEAEMKRLKSPA